MTLNLKIEIIPEAAEHYGVQRVGGGKFCAPMALTTEHAASANGIPVLVDAAGNGPGPEDQVPGTLRLARQCMEIAEAATWEVAPAGADAIISKFVGRKPW